MPTGTFITVLGYVFSVFYGSAAVYLVFETKNTCPFRWPLLFGVVGVVSHFAINDVPHWWPPSITRDMLIAILLLSLLVIGIELLRRLICEYGLRGPREIIRGIVDR